MNAEVIVVGGGIVGLWTAYTLASRNVKTMLFEQFPYPHTRGSSHGQTRITRTAQSEERYSAMMPEANRKWKELGRITGKETYVETGLLYICDFPSMAKSFAAVQRNTERYESDTTVVNGEELPSRFPGIKGGSDLKAIYDGGAGLLRADACLLALQQAFKDAGGILRERDPVISVKSVIDREVEVLTNTMKYRARSVVLTCGAYINKLLSTMDFQIPVKPTRQIVYYWREKSGSKYSVEGKFPAIIRGSLMERDEMYSIPSYEYPGLVKICMHGPGAYIDPVQRDSDLISEGTMAEDGTLRQLKAQINALFTDIDTTSGPAIAEVCMYTRSPDSNFILDYHPRFRNVIIGSFSGHGFKTSPSVGHILANMALGLDPPYPIKPFSLDRFAAASKL